MPRRALALLLLLPAVLLCFAATADAAGYRPSVTTAEQANGIIFYHNGSIEYGTIDGTLSVANPATSSALSDASATLPNGSAVPIGRVGPSSSYSTGYSLDGSGVPLTLRETAIPSSLATGVPGQLRLCVEVANAGSANITGFTYSQALPPGLSVAWKSYSGGVLDVGDNVTWTLDPIRPGESKNIAIAFNLTPSSDAYFPEARVAFSYGASLAGNATGFTGNADTSFRIQKSNPNTGLWHVAAYVPDDSEFVIELKNVTIYRSDASDPFNTTLIAYYEPGVSLDPGCSWNTSLDDRFSAVPAYFIKPSYVIPYTLVQSASVQARTEPITVGVFSPSPTISPPYNPYVPPAAATPVPSVLPSPSPTPAPVAGTDIVFIAPGSGDVIVDNSTWLETSVPPSNSPEYVAYYGSTDNLTWSRIGESSVAGNVSGLVWTVPQQNGKFYLKAEHYDDFGLKGVAFTQVLIAHDISPVDMSTILLRGQDWLMLSLAGVAIVLSLFILVPFIRRRPVVYDSSALRALSRDGGDWASKLSDKAIRPRELPPDLDGIGRLKAVGIKRSDEIVRLKREFAMGSYDALVLRLAKEAGATVYTDDPKMLEACRKLRVRAVRVVAPAVKIK